MLTLAQNWVLFQNGALLADMIAGGGAAVHRCDLGAQFPTAL
jgi:hypothetical protein